MCAFVIMLASPVCAYAAPVYQDPEFQYDGGYSFPLTCTGGSTCLIQGQTQFDGGVMIRAWHMGAFRVESALGQTTAYINGSYRDQQYVDSIDPTNMIWVLGSPDSVYPITPVSNGGTIDVTQGQSITLSWSLDPGVTIYNSGNSANYFDFLPFSGQRSSFSGFSPGYGQVTLTPSQTGTYTVTGYGKRDYMYHVPDPDNCVIQTRDPDTGEYYPLPASGLDCSVSRDAPIWQDFTMSVSVRVITVQPPTSMAYHCAADGRSVSFTWPAASGATVYYPRYSTSQGSCSAGWTMYTDGTTCYINSYGSLEASATIVPDATYNGWVHAGDPVDWTSPAVTGAFSCPDTTRVGLPTCAVTVTPNPIDRGASATVSWSSSNATSMTLNTIGPVGLSGSTGVAPSGTTNYGGTASGTDGSTITCPATLTVTQPSASINVQKI